MTYEQTYTTKPEHIDFQGIMDGLYYPFYLEECRHRYAKEVLGLGLEEAAAQGLNIVLSQYTIKFLRSLRKDDTFVVTCSGHPDKEGKPRFHLKQEIRRDGKLVVTALFTATCVKATGGRSFVPEGLLEKLQAAEPVVLPAE